MSLRLLRLLRLHVVEATIEGVAVLGPHREVKDRR